MVAHTNSVEMWCFSSNIQHQFNDFHVCFLCLLPGAKRSTADVVWSTLRHHVEEDTNYMKWEKVGSQAVWRDLRFALRKAGLTCPVRAFKRKWYQEHPLQFATDTKRLMLLGMDSSLAQIITPEPKEEKTKKGRNKSKK